MSSEQAGLLCKKGWVREGRREARHVLNLTHDGYTRKRVRLVRMDQASCIAHHAVCVTKVTIDIGIVMVSQAKSLRDLACDSTKK